MLEGCHAYVVGRDEEHDYSLMQTVGTLGFTSLSKLFRKGVPRVDKTRPGLSFFLVHHQLEEQAMRSVITAVRCCDSDPVRFAPLVVFLDDGPFELVLRYVRFGFDDVIILPERRELVASRLSGQLDREVTYFKTHDYFGPDRRRMELPPDPSEEFRNGRRSHTCYTIIRSPDKGVRILRKETCGSGPAAADLLAASPEAIAARGEEL
ncbi:MAG: hypothetical protein Q8L54_03685 [Devosia sp.]|nr:hypothetical protein [Devosia sp.]